MVRNMWVPGIVKRNETAWHLVWRKAEFCHLETNGPRVQGGLDQARGWDMSSCGASLVELHS
jgi:hypothetical protein